MFGLTEKKPRGEMLGLKTEEVVELPQILDLELCVELVNKRTYER